MTKTLLRAAIIINILIILDSWYFSYKFYLLGEPLWQQESFRGWFVYASIINFLGMFILAFYFKSKGYTSALKILIGIALAAVFGTVVTYQVIGTGIETRWVDHMAFASMQIVGLLYAIALINSNVSERPYLKLLGQALCVYVPITVTLYILFFTSTNPEFRNTINGIFAWTEPLSSLLLLLYLANFVDELKVLNKSHMQVA